MTTKVYPDRTLELALRDKGHVVNSLWQIPGPKDTGIAWIECLLAGGVLFLVETFHSGGWEVYRILNHGRALNDAIHAADVLIKNERYRIEGKSPLANALNR